MKIAEEELQKLKKWLEEINPSAAVSLTEHLEELITACRLRVSPLLRKTLHSTNPIESMFSAAGTKTARLKSIKQGKMAQR